jgi:error-prone DNA polymerase
MEGKNQYAELQVTSNFSFLRGGSHPHELMEEAAALGYTAIGLTDRNTLAGIVRVHAAAKNLPTRFLPGCRLDLQDGPSVLAYPTNKSAYASLSQLLSKGNLRTEKGQSELYVADLFTLQKDMKLLVVPPSRLNAQFELDQVFQHSIETYKEALGDQLYLCATRQYGGQDGKLLFRLSELSKRLQIPLVATNDVHYHHKQRRELQDLLTCIREKSTIYTAGYKLHANAERYLKSVEEMNRLFRQYPDAIRQTLEIAEACSFSLSELAYKYPREIVPEGTTPMEYLTQLSWEGAHRHYGEEIPEKIRKNILHELAFIKEMNFAEYFLTVEDIVREARSRGILCQGRGSAANSTVCFCLGITSVDPMKHDLLFERFISSARNEPPDIDIDFEHERREEMMQYVYQKYGRERAAIVATVTHMHYRGAVRDVGRAMGLSVDTIKQLAGMEEEQLEVADPQVRKTFELIQQYRGFPRQLGQHTGGFVITDGLLADLCPIMNATMEARTNIEWNKDDIDALGFLKIDLLALGMLTCIRKSFDLLKQHYGQEWSLATIPQDDPEVYDMICQADTIGVFQIESRAQQSMLPRLKPRCFYDLVIEVAIVRPGPIQGDMVHPYLRRRNGEDPIEFPSKELEEILGRTLGVPLFQEQAMKIAIVAAGFSPSEADELRRSMATFKVHGMVTRFEKKLIEGMVRNGYSEEFARKVFKQLEGFGSYGFPESHAASFAHLVYVSCWIKCHYPDVFAVALLNSQPMGFYQPAQIVNDARQHGVIVKGPDINHSFWDNTLEGKEGKYHVVRLGFRQIKGMRLEEAQKLVAERGQPYKHLDEVRHVLDSQPMLEKLADADAFQSMGLNRREALWQAVTKDAPVALYKNQVVPETSVELPQMSDSENVVQDYASISFSLKAHPVSFVRDKLDRLNIVPAAKLKEGQHGASVRVAGLVLVRQRPGTAKGVCFMTIEDETGIANLVVFGKRFEKYRKEILQSRLVMVEGQLQIEGEVIHVIVEQVFNFSSLLRVLTPARTHQLPLLTLAYPDEGAASIVPRSRDFK